MCLSIRILVLYHIFPLILVNSVDSVTISGNLESDRSTKYLVNSIVDVIENTGTLAISLETLQCCEKYSINFNNQAYFLVILMDYLI